MKKLFVILIALLITSSCFASDTYIRNKTGDIVTPALSGSTFTSSSAVITAGGALSFGTTSPIAKVLVSVPGGTAYIGTSTVTMATGLALASTQGVLSLDLNTLSGLYWIGPANQKINFIVIQ